MYTMMTALEDVQEAMKTNEAALLYISHPGCNVCTVIKPQIAEMISETFPKIALYEIDSNQSPEIAAAYSVFAVPTVLVFFEGRENFRFARNFSLSVVEEQIARPYSLFFE